MNDNEKKTKVFENLEDWIVKYPLPNGELTRIYQGDDDPSVLLFQPTGLIMSHITNAANEIEGLLDAYGDALNQIERMRAEMKALPAAIFGNIAAFADTEELTFPLSSPTPEEQGEWRKAFLQRAQEHAEGLVDDLLSSDCPTSGETEQGLTSFECLGLPVISWKK